MAFTLIIVLLVLGNIFFIIKMQYEIQDYRREQKRLLNQIHLTVERVEKKTSDLQHEIDNLERSFKGAQSEIFKWQESLQTQLNTKNSKPQEDVK